MILAINWLNTSINLLLVVFVLVCFLLSLVVLMQRPKQEGLGAAFGSGMTDQMFGARTTSVLQKGTVYLATLFFLLTITLAILYAKQSTSGGTMVAETTEEAGAAEETPATGEEAPATGEEAPATGEEAPATGEETPATGEETPATVEETPAAGEEAPATGEETPATGDETPATGEETPEAAGEPPADPAAPADAAAEGTEAPEAPAGE